jgi:hypothetical protein
MDLTKETVQHALTMQNYRTKMVLWFVTVRQDGTVQDVNSIMAPVTLPVISPRDVQEVQSPKTVWHVPRMPIEIAILEPVNVKVNTLVGNVYNTEVHANTFLAVRFVSEIMKVTVLNVSNMHIWTFQPIRIWIVIHSTDVIIAIVYARKDGADITVILTMMHVTTFVTNVTLLPTMTVWNA